jgi:hypothetical protein
LADATSFSSAALLWLPKSREWFADRLKTAEEVNVRAPKPILWALWLLGLNAVGLLLVDPFFLRRVERPGQEFFIHPIVCLALGLLYAFARGMQKRKKWVRTVMTLLSGLSLFWMYGLFQRIYAGKIYPPNVPLTGILLCFLSFLFASTVLWLPASSRWFNREVGVTPEA